MKNQALFSLKDKSKKLKCHLLQFLFGALSASVQRTMMTSATTKLPMQSDHAPISMDFFL